MKLEVKFDEVLDRVGYEVSLLFKCSIDEREIPGAVKLMLVGDFLRKYGINEKSSPHGPERLEKLDQENLARIGELLLRRHARQYSSNQIISMCAGDATEPVLRVHSQDCSANTLKDLIARLEEELDQPLSIGFKPV